MITFNLYDVATVVLVLHELLDRSLRPRTWWSPRHLGRSAPPLACPRHGGSAHSPRPAHSARARPVLRVPGLPHDAQPALHVHVALQLRHAAHQLLQEVKPRLGLDTELAAIVSVRTSRNFLDKQLTGDSE